MQIFFLFSRLPSILLMGPFVVQKLFSLFYLFIFRAALKAYGGSQARGRTGATGASLHHSHSNEGSKLRLRPTPQFTAMPDL